MNNISATYLFIFSGALLGITGSASNLPASPSAVSRPTANWQKLGPNQPSQFYKTQAFYANTPAPHTELISLRWGKKEAPQETIQIEFQSRRSPTNETGYLHIEQHDRLLQIYFHNLKSSQVSPARIDQLAADSALIAEASLLADPLTGGGFLRLSFADAVELAPRMINKIAGGQSVLELKLRKVQQQ